MLFRPRTNSDSLLTMTGTKVTPQVSVSEVEVGIEFEFASTPPDPQVLLQGVTIGRNAKIEDGYLLYWDTTSTRSWLVVTRDFAICLVYDFSVRHLSRTAVAWMKPRAFLAAAIVEANQESKGRTALLRVDGRSSLVVLEPFGSMDAT